MKSESRNQRGITQLVIVIIVILAIILGIYLVQTQTNLLPKAYENRNPLPPTPSTTAVQRHNPGEFKRVDVTGSYSKIENTIRINMTNCEDVRFSFYTLTYTTTEGIEKTLTGGIFPNGVNTFDTHIAIPHSNVSNIKFHLTGEYQPGRTIDITLDIAS